MVNIYIVIKIKIPISPTIAYSCLVELPTVPQKQFPVVTPMEFSIFNLFNSLWNVNIEIYIKNYLYLLISTADCKARTKYIHVS
jgi:hypothetical protein